MLRFWVVFVFALLVVGCDTDPVPADGGPDASVSGPAAALADYAGSDFYTAPWPDERLRQADGTIRIDHFPNPRGVAIVQALVDVLEGVEGFGVSSGVFFPLSAPIDPGSLPSGPEASLQDGASLFVVDVDPDSPERGTRHPVRAYFETDTGPFGAPNLLAVLPVQGRPLPADRLMAAVVTTSVRSEDGSPLSPAPSTAEILAGTRPEGLSEAAFLAHQAAVDALPDTEVAAMAVFRTDDPTRVLHDANAQLEAHTLAVDGPFEAREVFDDYCVFRTTVPMPDFQGGEAPYATEGGGWVRDAAGMLSEQRSAESAVYVTVPRQTMPSEGFPTALFVRTGGGGDRPLVDRGRRAEAGGEAIAPGTGPALTFAQAGWVGVTVDGPLGGLRNPRDWDEQFAIFNINNPPALRDSIRQSALELALLARALETVRFDASSCPDLDAPDGEVALDTRHLTLMGHSMGATIAPLAAAIEPRFAALILSGAGGSWLANVVFKESPLPVRSTAETLLQYTARGRTLDEFDPTLSLLQWAGEPADPQVYAREVTAAPLNGAPRHILMFQGILDTYIPPPVANPLTLAFGLDLGGDALDTGIARFAPLEPLLPLSGRARRGLPLSGNLRSGAVTGVVVQHPADDVEDGHEVVFQTDGPRQQYRCFLESLVSEDVPVVVPSDLDACP
ncbi:MAG: hypothetical protein AB8I08_05235 [Sandaracinaceae bacterium]